MLLTVLAIAVTSCTYVPAGSTVTEASKTAPTIIQQVGIDGRLVIYDLKYEGRTYIIAQSPSGLTMVEHSPKPIVMAQPSAQSLASYYNPEKRPNPDK